MHRWSKAAAVAMTPALACGWSITEPLIVSGGTTGDEAEGNTITAVSDSSGGGPLTAVSDSSGGGPLTAGCTAAWEGAGPSFDAPVALTSLNSSGLEADPRLSSDGLVLTFSSDRPGMGGYDFYVAQRDDPAEPFGAPVARDALNSAFDDTALSQTPDGVYYFASSRGPEGRSTLWRATLAPALVQEALTALDAPGRNFDPFVSSDGQWLYWTVDDGLATNLRAARRLAPDAPFEPAGGLPFESEAFDDSLTFTADARIAAWSSARPGGAGEHDVWFAIRGDASAAFGAPSPLPGINTPAQDREVFVTADGCAVYFASDRPGGLGVWDLYVAHVLSE